MKKIKTGDKVKVIAGKFKWTVSKVDKVEWDRAFVKGVNMVKKAVKGQGFVDKTLPIHISNIMFYCEWCNKPVRVSRTFDEKWKKVRQCRKCWKNYK